MSGEWEKRIGLADMNGTVATVGFTPADSDGDAITSLTLKTGGAHIFSSPTPQACRQLAAALLDGADAMEAGE